LVFFFPTLSAFFAVNPVSAVLDSFFKDFAVLADRVSVALRAVFHTDAGWALMWKTRGAYPSLLV
jgi:hypothetical protein